MSLLRRLGAEQSGFTLIEIMVSALILASVALGSMQVLASSAKVNYRSEQAQVAIDKAQAELEALRTLDFDQVALNAEPPSAPPGGPTDRLAPSCTNQGVSTDGCFALNDNGTNLAPLVVEGGELEDGSTVTGAAIAAGPEPFTNGDVSGNVYRYVVWQNDYACAESQCPGMQDRKRMVIVVTLDRTADGSRPYREVQSDVIDPELGKDIQPQPTPQEEVTAQQFWMTNTPCDGAVRTFPESDNSLHNTLGTCAGTNPPDLLAPEPPSLNPSFLPEQQPLFDFATDIEPLSGGDSDKGLQIRRDGASGCNYTPSGTAPRERTHRWVTDPIPSDATFVVDGEANLELWSQTLGGVAASGRVCVFLFIRETNAQGQPVDTMIGDAGNFAAPYFSHELDQWPAGDWQTISIPLALEPPPGESVVRLLPGQRLGLAINVAAETGVDALQFAYEHTDFDSRLEVETSTPLTSG